MADRRQVRRTILKAAFATLLSLWASEAMADPTDRWATEIAAASARFGIPEAWVRRVMRAESGGGALLNGRPIVSRAGAMGLMQLMPGTWNDMRSMLGLGPDPYDPADNILAGTAYLRAMYDRFGYPAMFAAYNAGPGRYAAYLAGTRGLPAETRAYVSSVVGTGRPLPSAARPASAPIFALAAAGKPGVAAAAPSSAGSAGLFVQLGGWRTASPDRRRGRSSGTNDGRSKSDGSTRAWTER